jgi:hypothetical protein
VNFATDSSRCFDVQVFMPTMALFDRRRPYPSKAAYANGAPQSRFPA